MVSESSSLGDEVTSYPVFDIVEPILTKAWAVVDGLAVSLPMQFGVQ